MHNLRALYGGLEALYGTDSGVDPTAFIVPFSARPRHGPEQLIAREIDGELHLALALDQNLLARIEQLPAAVLLSDEALADGLPALEGLSHLLYVCEAARRGRPISGLELETQAEVDKFAMCLLHRWPLTQTQVRALLERLYYQFHFADGLSPSLRQRYKLANRLALAFAHKLVHLVNRGALAQLRRTLHDFWHRPMADKAYLAGV